MYQKWAQRCHDTTIYKGSVGRLSETSLQGVSASQKACSSYILPHPRPFPSELGKGDSTAES